MVCDVEWDIIGVTDLRAQTNGMFAVQGEYYNGYQGKRIKMSGRKNHLFPNKSLKAAINRFRLMLNLEGSFFNRLIASWRTMLKFSGA